MATQHVTPYGGLANTPQPATPTHQQPQSLRTQKRLAQGLGWFSIGLGLVEVIAPRALGRLIGVRKHTTLVRLFGFREIANGIGIISTRRPAGWMWARVAGDAMDLACLSAAVAATGRRRRTRGVAATAAVAGVAALDILCSTELSGEMVREPVRVQKTISVNRPPEQVYQFWRDFRNLPRFMKNVESVQPDGQTRSHWVMKAPGGRSIEWDAEVVEERAHELIAWRCVPGSCMESSGSVQFKPSPGGRGTYVTLDLQFTPPGGALGRSVAQLFRAAPENRIREDLRRFKQLMETGEIATTEGQPSGRKSSAVRPNALGGGNS